MKKVQYGLVSLNVDFRPNSFYTHIYIHAAVVYFTVFISMDGLIT